MLCSISKSRIYRSLFSVSSYIHHFSTAVDAVDLIEDNSHSVFDTQISQNPIFFPPTPIFSPNLNQPRAWSCAVRSESKIPQSAENWARQKMHECAMAGNLMEALQNLNLLNPTILDCNALLYCYLKSGRISIDHFDEADEEVFEVRVMGLKGCSPDRVTYNILFHALCCHNRILDASDLVEDMLKKGCHPDQFTYCTLAACMLNAGLVRKSQELLVKVLSGDSPGDVAIWNVYLHSLCHDNHVWEALSLLGHKIEEGFVPTTLTFNTILKGFCMEKKLDEALNFLDQCYWSREGPDLISFNTILSAACKDGNSRIIMRVFNRMEIEGVEADVITMTCLVQFFGNAGKILDCYRLFMHIIKNGYNPTTITFNVLLDILCKKKLIEHASRIFINFKGCGTFPDTTSYNILIRAAIRKNCYFSVRCLLANMYRWGLLPDGTTYELLSYGLCRLRSISAALSLEYGMIENDVRPSITFYNTIMDAMFRSGRLGDVYLLLCKMEIDGVELNEASTKILKHALSKGGRKRFPKAMMALENLIEMF